MEKSEIYLSVIVPFYNDEKKVHNMETISAYLQKQAFSYEIIAVSDGSQDKTVEMLRNMAPQVPNLKVIDRKENHGKGYTVREGMMAAKGKIRLFTDSDNGTDISNFEKMRPLFDQGYDVVISSRDKKDAPGAGQLHPQPWLKRQMGNMGNLYIQIVAGLWGIWDTQNGFKAFRDHAAERIFKVSKIDRWTFDVEVLTLAKRFGYKIGIIPIMWTDDPDTRVNLWGYIKSLLDVAKFRWNIIRGKYNEEAK